MIVVVGAGGVATGGGGAGSCAWADTIAAGAAVATELWAKAGVANASVVRRR
jgi:hypothetical protein